MTPTRGINTAGDKVGEDGGKTHEARSISVKRDPGVTSELSIDEKMKNITGKTEPPKFGAAGLTAGLYNREM